jgi:hypothetical protein
MYSSVDLEACDSMTVWSGTFKEIALYPQGPAV